MRAGHVLWSLRPKSIKLSTVTATNETPHERLFNFKRRSTFGVSVPTWLGVPGPVLLKRHGRSSKYDPVVEDVDLVHATPNYAVVRFPSGKESTVSVKDISPAGSSRENNSGEIEPPLQLPEDVHLPQTFAEDRPDSGDVAARPNTSDAITSDEDGQTKSVARDTEHNVPLRMSSCLRKPVERYGAVRSCALLVCLFWDVLPRSLLIGGKSVMKCVRLIGSLHPRFIG